MLETKQSQEYPLKDGKFNMACIEKKATEVVRSIIKQMDLRYKDNNDELLSSTIIASFRNWPIINEPGKEKCLLACSCFIELF
jgi:hypothetical protein